MSSIERFNQMVDNDNELLQAINKVNMALEEATKEDEEFVEVDDLFEEIAKSKIVMKIQPIESDGKNGYALYYGNDGVADQFTCSSEENVDGMLHKTFVEEMRNLAYQGYRLYQPKDWEREEL